MMGVSPEQFVERISAAGVDAIGVNCGSCDLRQVETLVSVLRGLTDLPIIARPNAGIPRLENGVTVFDASPEALGIAAVGLVSRCVCRRRVLRHYTGSHRVNEDASRDFRRRLVSGCIGTGH